MIVSMALFEGASFFASIAYLNEALTVCPRRQRHGHPSSFRVLSHGRPDHLLARPAARCFAPDPLRAVARAQGVKTPKPSRKRANVFSISVNRFGTSPLSQGTDHDHRLTPCALLVSAHPAGARRRGAAHPDGRLLGFAEEGGRFDQQRQYEGRVGRVDLQLVAPPHRGAGPDRRAFPRPKSPQVRRHREIFTVYDQGQPRPIDLDQNGLGEPWRRSSPGVDCSSGEWCKVFDAHGQGGRQGRRAHGHDARGADGPQLPRQFGRAPGQDAGPVVGGPFFRRAGRLHLHRPLEVPQRRHTDPGNRRHRRAAAPRHRRHVAHRRFHRHR